MLAGRTALSLLLIQYAAGGQIREVQTLITLQERRPIRVRLVRIRRVQSGFNHLSFDINAPTVADSWKSAELAQRMLPLPEPGFVAVGDSEVRYDGSFERIDEMADDSTWPGFTRNFGSTGHLRAIMERVVSSEPRPADVVYVGVFGSPLPST